MDTRRVLAGRYQYSDCLFLCRLYLIDDRHIGRLRPVTLWFPVYVLAVDYCTYFQGNAADYPCLRLSIAVF